MQTSSPRKADWSNHQIPTSAAVPPRHLLFFPLPSPFPPPSLPVPFSSPIFSHLLSSFLFFSLLPPPFFLCAHLPPVFPIFLFPSHLLFFPPFFPLHVPFPFCLLPFPFCPLFHTLFPLANDVDGPAIGPSTSLWGIFAVDGPIAGPSMSLREYKKDNNMEIPL